MANLSSVLDRLVADEAGFAIEAPESWAQGRTLYGGVSAALAAQAAALAFADLPPLRSALFSFVAPAAGRLRLTPTLLRSGRSASVVGVDVHSGDALALRATLTYGAARDSALNARARLSVAPKPPGECEPLMPLREASPRFFGNFEQRRAGAARPFSGDATAARYEVWARFVEPPQADPTIALLALADSLPPAACARFAALAPISTMTWSVDFTQPIAAGEWRYLTSQSEAAADGYSQQAMEAFDADGQRLAVGRQTVAIFA